jgi:hypothetical protein
MPSLHFSKTDNRNFSLRYAFFIDVQLSFVLQMFEQEAKPAEEMKNVVDHIAEVSPLAHV